jgi:hypothetical protein
LVALAAVGLAWSLGWLWLAGQVTGHMDAASRAWASQGGELSWDSRRIYGFPFRIDVDLTNARARGASGSGLSIPVLQTEAFVFAPTHWVGVAPQGAVLWRKRGEPVVVKAKVLRASVSDFAAHPPRIAVEGLGLTFATPKGAKPAFITSAAELHFHAMAGPDDQGAVLLELDGATARLGGLFARIAQGRPIGITGDLIYSHAGAFAGPDWPSAVAAWSGAGGAITVRHVAITAGEAMLDARSGTLTVGPDGRLAGSLAASLRQAPRALAAMDRAGAISPGAAGTAANVPGAQGGRALVTVTVDFEAGQTTLGPAAIGPAPKIY